jgi:hypothetical protein
MQVVVNPSNRSVIATYQGTGRSHDFKLFKQSNLNLLASTQAITDSGYQGIKKVHTNSITPIKRKRGQKLTNEEKKYNRKVAQDRVLNENVIGSLKRFKIISDRYRNRRKRFGLRFNLIAGIYNFELKNGF